jgi:hypothetical protein
VRKPNPGTGIGCRIPNSLTGKEATLDLQKIEWSHVVLPFAGRFWPISWAFYHLNMRLLGEVIAIGDTANPVVPPTLDLTVGILNFPMFYLWFPVGEWLKPYLTDNGVMELFVALNAVFWAGVVKWFLRLAFVSVR